ncbi:GntR family transcriptional regulator [Fictibacillus sp. JL2B1089]|uniref:GntR family transcriptional regulator n=1 Tax=Fictibacillus sp. JL2B1089 TaxID=3399565 RepID=UPI003A8504FD
MILKDNRLPLYYQLMDLLIGKIKSGQFAEEDQLPSERELCETYQVSRTTVRQTIQELEKEGYIYKLHGKGTFVAKKVHNQSLVKIYSFTEEMKKVGKTPSIQIISFQKTVCSSKIARIINLSVEDEVYIFKRLRLADQDPMLIETSYLPVSRFKNLSSKDLEHTSMYEWFRNEYDMNISKASESFKAISVMKDEAEILNIEEGTPCLQLERIAYEQSEIIEYTVSVARGDKFTYTVELT